ncbi:MAG: hypothetical protein R3C49_16975 [Planctomycetaceae bacterium]
MKSVKPPSGRILCHSPASASRRGGIRVEMVVCTVILSISMMILVPAVRAVQLQRRSTETEVLTLIELNNLASLSSAQPVDQLELTSTFAQRFPAATLQHEAVTIDDPAGMTASRLTIVHPGSRSVPDIKRSLVVWWAESKTQAAGDQNSEAKE